MVVKIDEEGMPSQQIVYQDFWACPRQITLKWGCKDIITRMVDLIDTPDVCFGKTDGIPEGIPTVDINPDSKPTYLCNWQKMPFEDNQFNFGFWDPPYNKIYKKSYKEIWRCCKTLAVLHQIIVPMPVNSTRTHMIAITTGPMQRIRCLQVFKKNNKTLLEFGER
jgi:hypothetical protein